MRHFYLILFIAINYHIQNGNVLTSRHPSFKLERHCEPNARTSHNRALKQSAQTKFVLTPIPIRIETSEPDRLLDPFSFQGYTRHIYISLNRSHARRNLNILNYIFFSSVSRNAGHSKNRRADIVSTMTNSTQTRINSCEI